MQRISFTTADGVEIVGSFESVPGAAAAVLCLHMLPRDRQSFRSIQAVLSRHNLSSLAIDLRGHGESVKQAGRTLDYRNFSDAEHQQSIEDANAAIAWLEAQGFPSNKIGVIGASIGANLALQSATRYSLLATCLLSPGTDYHGVTTLNVAAKLKDPQALLVIASSGDDDYGFESSQQIMEQATVKDKKFLPYQNGGHAMQLFEADPTLEETVAVWLADRL